MSRFDSSKLIFNLLKCHVFSIERRLNLLQKQKRKTKNEEGPPEDFTLFEKVILIGKNRLFLLRI